MSTWRMIEFETTTDEGQQSVVEAVTQTFEAVVAEQPAGIRLAYWLTRDGRRFVALLELDDEASNPLLSIAAARALPGVIGSHVNGGYPSPEIMDLLGRYGFDDAPPSVTALPGDQP